jgi:hypothetical protein
MKIALSLFIAGMAAAAFTAALVLAPVFMFGTRHEPFRIPPDLSKNVVLIPEPEASAYHDGRKLVNDNQRNYIDALAQEAKP